MSIAKALFSVYGQVKKDKSATCTCIYEMNLYLRRIIWKFHLMNMVNCHGKEVQFF